MRAAGEGIFAAERGGAVARIAAASRAETADVPETSLAAADAAPNAAVDGERVGGAPRASGGAACTTGTRVGAGAVTIGGAVRCGAAAGTRAGADPS